MRPEYSPDLVSTLIFSPSSTNKGTWMVTPVSSSAGFVAPDTVSPLIPGSDFAMFNSTNGGASTEMEVLQPKWAHHSK